MIRTTSKWSRGLANFRTRCE